MTDKTPSRATTHHLLEAFNAEGAVEHPGDPDAEAPLSPADEQGATPRGAGAGGAAGAKHPERHEWLEAFNAEGAIEHPGEPAADDSPSPADDSATPPTG